MAKYKITVSANRHGDKISHFLLMKVIWIGGIHGQT